MESRKPPRPHMGRALASRLTRLRNVMQKPFHPSSRVYNSLKPTQMDTNNQI
jgi:hypothetical protein